MGTLTTNIQNTSGEIIENLVAKPAARRLLVLFLILFMKCGDPSSLIFITAFDDKVRMEMH